MAALLAAWDVNSVGAAAGLAQISELAAGVGFPGLAAFLAAVNLHTTLAKLGYDPAAPCLEGRAVFKVLGTCWEVPWQRYVLIHGRSEVAIEVTHSRVHISVKLSQTYRF